MKLLQKHEKTNVQITKNFNLSEMEYYDVIPPLLIVNATELLINLQVLRDACNKPVTILSGYRSVDRNKAVGGSVKSQHMSANAADIQVKDMSPIEVKTLIEKLIKEGKMKQGGLGIYNDWVHYDTRGIIARWDNRTA